MREVRLIGGVPFNVMVCPPQPTPDPIREVEMSVDIEAGMANQLDGVFFPFTGEPIVGNATDINAHVDARAGDARLFESLG
jgi:hypothetical protein